MFNRVHLRYKIVDTVWKKYDKVRKAKVFPHLYPMYQLRKADPSRGPVDLNRKPPGVIKIKWQRWCKERMTQPL